jgi:hypothetical protein
MIMEELNKYLDKLKKVDLTELLSNVIEDKEKELEIIGGKIERLEYLAFLLLYLILQAALYCLLINFAVFYSFWHCPKSFKV